MELILMSRKKRAPTPVPPPHSLQTHPRQQYTEARQKEGLAFTTKRDDFFPYADGPVRWDFCLLYICVYMYMRVYL